MATKTVNLKSSMAWATLNKVSYDTETNDLTLYYADGAVIRFMNVLSSIIDELSDLKNEKVSDDSIIDYLTNALSKHYKKAKTYRYNRVIIKQATKKPVEKV